MSVNRRVVIANAIFRPNERLVTKRLKWFFLFRHREPSPELMHHHLDCQPPFQHRKVWPSSRPSSRIQSSNNETFFSFCYSSSSYWRRKQEKLCRMAKLYQRGSKFSYSSECSCNLHWHRLCCRVMLPRIPSYCTKWRKKGKADSGSQSGVSFHLFHDLNNNFPLMRLCSNLKHKLHCWNIKHTFK